MDAPVWRPIETAPKDGTLVIVHAAARDGLAAFETVCRWHPDAGWCVDELREVTLWMPLPLVGAGGGQLMTDPKAIYLAAIESAFAAFLADPVGAKAPYMFTTATEDLTRMLRGSLASDRWLKRHPTPPVDAAAPPQEDPIGPHFPCECPCGCDGRFRGAAGLCMVCRLRERCIELRAAAPPHDKEK